MLNVLSWTQKLIQTHLITLEFFKKASRFSIMQELFVLANKTDVINVNGDFISWVTSVYVLV